MPDRVVTFGEIMMRLNPPGNQRLQQADSFVMTFAGAEANVAASIANFGGDADFVTGLPDNDLGRSCARALRGQGVGVGHIVWAGERLGLLFTETGAAQRGSKVVYDRAGSSFAALAKDSIQWTDVLRGASWFHFTGVTPAVGSGPAEACAQAAETARKMGMRVSCDLNYRAKLWSWGRKAGEVMGDLVRQCDLVIANEEDADKVFGIAPSDVDVTKGDVAAEKYVGVCEQLSETFPNLRNVAVTLRGSVSASHNTWSGLLWSDGEMLYAPTYDIIPIVDRVGGGDAFAGALIFALGTAHRQPQEALEFAVAASCLKHSVYGDFNTVSVEEVDRLAAGNASGRVAR